jgi:hypothetical protein
MWTDGQADMTKLMVAFLYFANAPQKDTEQGRSLKRLNGYLKCQQA